MSVQSRPTLYIESAYNPDACVVRIEGELDLAGCPELDLALCEAEQSPARRIILDLEDLTFIDSAGLRSLLSASRRSASNRNRLELTRGKGQPAYMFSLTGLERVLPLTDPALCPAIRVTLPPRRRHSGTPGREASAGATPEGQARKPMSRSSRSGGRSRLARGPGEPARMPWLTMLDLTLPLSGPAGNMVPTDTPKWVRA
jgi:anti-anti-sigma factor